MNILIDNNNILAIENEDISNNKQYSYNLNWFQLSDFDKKIVVYHKKQFKIINLKDLWDRMWVIMVWEHDDEYDNMELDIESMESATKLFSWFNENNWEKYFFLYKYWENKMNLLNENLSKLWSNISFLKWEKWITTSFNDEELVYNPISFIFGLILVYGNFQIKDWDLKAVKAQIPLFWQFLDNKDIIDETIDVLAENWLFINKNIINTEDWIIYEIASSDFELLEFFAKFYEPIEKWLKISKIDEVQKVKWDLINFLQTNINIPTIWKDDVINALENGMIKILIKS